MMLKIVIVLSAIWTPTVLCQNASVMDYYRNFEKLFDLKSACDDIPEAVSTECKEQFLESCRNETVLFKMFDATAKFPYSGLAKASHFDYGDYDECMEIDHQYDTGRILGKYCFSGLAIPDLTDPRNFDQWFKLAVCKPDKCSADDYNIIFNISRALDIRLPGLFNDISCFTKDYQTELVTYDIITICVIGFIVALMIMSTVYDLYLQRNNKKPFHPLSIAFSVYTNGQKLIKTTNNNKEQVLVMNGLKVFSMLWVIYGHGGNGWRQLAIINKEAFTTLLEDMEGFYLSSAYLAVDTFFFISGFLYAWSYLKTKTIPLKLQIMNIPIGYVYRYLRLTPALAALLIVDMSLFKHFGSGPIWNTVIENLQGNCQKYWWSSLLYIQNYYNYNNLCMIHTWYLSADMQTACLAPFVIIPLAVALRNPKKLMHCMIAMLALNFLLVAVPIWIKMIYRENQNEYETHTRLVDFFLGMMVGAYMRETKDRPFLGTKMDPKKLSILNLLIWSIVLSILTAVLIGGRAIELHGSYEVYWTYEMVKKVFWSMVLTWIIYSSYYGYGGIVNWLLSTPLMQIGGKLSYCVYLVHGLVISFHVLSTRSKLYFSHYTMFYNWCGYFILSTVVSVFWTLAFESPFIILQTFLLRGGGRKKE